MSKHSDEILPNQREDYPTVDEKQFFRYTGNQKSQKPSQFYIIIRRNHSMVVLSCPVCGEELVWEGGSCRCGQNHSFDVARQGYVNLLPNPNKHSKHPGDTKEMVAARREFLDGGFYAPVAQALCELAQTYAPAGASLLDVGCGEGYYGTQAAQALNGELWGLDISKEAVRRAAGRYKNARWLCATGAKLPFREGSFHLLLSMFALTLPEEFRRVLAKKGIFIQVLAAEDHLMGLKSIIYPELLHKPKDSVPELPGFRLLESRHLEFSFTVEGAQIQNLLSMTPHLWRIDKAGAQRLADTKTLTDRASVMLNVYEAL